MLIKEYRIPMPMSVEEYKIAQLYMIQVRPCGVSQASCVVLAVSDNARIKYRVFSVIYTRAKACWSYQSRHTPRIHLLMKIFSVMCVEEEPGGE